MNRIAISVVMLLGPAGEKSAGLLQQVLSSVEWAAEMVVLDSCTGITWSNFRQTFPQLRVIPRHTETAECTDFTALRNQLGKHVTQPWVLWLDSDEVVFVANISNFQQLLINSEISGMTVLRSDVFWDTTLHHGEAADQPLVRLARSNKGKWHGKIHEILKIKGQVTRSDLQLTHYSHSSLTQFITAITNYAKIAARQKDSSFGANLTELVLFPIGKFVWNYVVRQGFRDGWAGLAYASTMSLHSLLVRIYYYEQTFATPQKT